jgi:S-DNA-T family DNA segregation ATPase FtsK/SpoIIIE
MRRLLELQANQIEAVLASHKIRARIWGGTVTPRLIRFHLSPSLDTRLSQIARLSEEMALSVGSPSCRVARRRGSIDLEFPRTDFDTVHLLPLCRRLTEVPACTAVLGLDEEGVPLLLRLPSPEVTHVLISGTTGCGKTSLAQTMIASLALHNHLADLGLILIDPQGRGYAPFADLPHLALPLAQEENQILHALHWLVGEMERRHQTTDARHQTTEGQPLGFPRLVVFVDELADLMLASSSRRRTEMLVGGREVERLLTRLAQRGRGAAIHLVAATQKPTAAVIGSLVKSNFPVRLVGSVPSPEDAKVASGLAGTGAERLMGRGDFLLVIKGQVLRFQGALISEGEIRDLVAQLRRGVRGLGGDPPVGTRGDSGGLGGIRRELVGTHRNS